MNIRPRFAANHLIAATATFVSAFLFAATVQSHTLLHQQPGSNQGNPGQNPAEQLEPGKPIERELAGGQQHAYQISLAEGQYLDVVVEQRGIDVVVRLLGPDGKQIVEIDAEIRTQGRETVSQVAEMAGNYQLAIQAKQKEAPAGRYEIRVAELRAATEKDRILLEARKLHMESVRLWSAGKYEEALPLAERAQAIREKALGPEHPDVADSLNILALLHRAKGNYEKAEPLYHRALAIREKALGPEHPLVTQSLNNLGAFYRGKGDYAKAEPFYLRALTIRKKVLGPEHGLVADSLNGLGILYNSKGDYVKAEQCYLRALEIAEKAYGPEHLLVTASLNNLAILYHRDKGDYVKAEPFYRHALAIHEKELGPTHPVVAYSIDNLASLYRDQGNHEKAEPLYQRSLAIFEKVFGPKHPNVGESLNNLALLYRDKGDRVKSEELSQRALAIFEKALGPKHPNVATSLNNLANLRRDKGDYAKAEPLYQRSLAIFEEALGPEHPDVAASLNNLADCYIAGGNPSQAISLRLRATTISERNIGLNLTTGSERQKLAYLATLSSETNRTVSLHVLSAPSDSTARDLALTTILQRKGRALDAMTDILAVLRRRANPQDQPLFDQLQDTDSQLARLVLNGPERITPAEHQQRIKALEEQREKLEADLSSRSAEFRTQSQPVTLAAVQTEIPDKAALVEFFAYRPFNAKSSKADEAFNSPRYVAYVLHKQGEIQWVDLGEAKAIDEAVSKLRQTLRCKQNLAEVKRLARVLDRRVMRPVRTRLGQAQHIIVSPDGALNLLPFAALVDEKDKYLIEKYELSYLTSGRDLLRLQVARESKDPPLIIANPDFGLVKGEALAQRGTAPRCERPKQSAKRIEKEQKDFQQISLLALPWTSLEAGDLKKLLPQATLLMGAQATKTSLKQANAPGLLHIATHGFFLQDSEPVVKGGRGLDFTNFYDLRSASWAAKIKNPLLRSGLALANFNEHRNGDDNGVLTALEAANLNLWGTKLVVLSACDTGIGEVRNGEGVYGLRRALVLAGAETQVMSLWPVKDKETRSLMDGYYQRLLDKKEGRGEALRQVQLKMLKTPGQQQHPFYWASFIQIGEWANLDGKR